MPRRIFTIEIAVLLERGLFLEDDQVLYKRDGAHNVVQVIQACAGATTQSMSRMGCVKYSLQSLSPLQSEAVDSQARRRKVLDAHIPHSVYIYALFWLVSCARSDSRIKMGFLFRDHG